MYSNVPWSYLQKNWTTVPDEYRNLSVVGKCCPVGEVLVHRGSLGGVCTSGNFSVAENFSPLFHLANASRYDRYGYHHDQFLAIVGNPCKYGRWVCSSSVYMFKQRVCKRNLHLNTLWNSLQQRLVAKRFWKMKHIED